jgi:hypothetical protein
MEGPEPTEDEATLDRNSSPAGFMTAGTSLFEWERRIIGASEPSEKTPELGLIEAEAEAEAGAEANARRAFWQRRKQPAV